MSWFYHTKYFIRFNTTLNIYGADSKCNFSEINVGSSYKEYLNSLHLPKVYQSLLNKVFEQKFENIKEVYRDSMREK